MKQDQSIERLLRSARPRDPAPGGIGPCLDAEMLAAWVDGGLTPNQVAQAELHVSSCARCQAMVAATMTSAPMTTSVSAAERPARSWGLGWLVPLAAGVAAVGLWFMVPSQTSLNAPPARETVAVPDAAPAPPALGQLAQAPVEESKPRDLRAPGSSVGGLSAERPERREAPKDVANEPAKQESSALARADAQEAGARPAAAAKSAGGSGSQDTLSGGAIAPPPSAPASVIVPAPVPRAALSAIAANRSAKAQVADLEIISPNPSIRWRMGPGGAVEHSTDGGTTWSLQSSGVSVELLGGASPLPDVCWLVGRAGTIIRTADGGQRWQRVTFSGDLDLVSVTASDASTAEVTAVGGRIFRTVDAGISWR